MTAWAVLLALLGGGMASASEQSELLYSRGMVEFHAERYREALALFDRAVEADATDPYARYYRGVTRGRLGDREGGIADLRAALKQKPDLDEAALELGVLLVENGEYEDALAWLAQAQRVESLDGQASLFLGLAQLRLRRESDALDSFRRAGERDPRLQVPSSYYQGVAAYQLGRWSDAEEHFRAVMSQSPSSQMGGEAVQFLALLRVRRHEKYELFGSVGFEYDTNVVLAPSSGALQDELAISNQADGRVTLWTGGSYVPWQREDVQLSVGYEFFQSLHFNLTDFNLQDHRPRVQLIGGGEHFRWGLLAHYDYYRLANDSFLQEGTVAPWFTIVDGTLGRTELYYRGRPRDFLDSSYRTRDSLNHALGLREVIDLGSPERWLAVGYQYEFEEPIHSDIVSRSFGYHANEANVGIGCPLPFGISGQATYAFRREDYSGASASLDPNGERRRDDEHEITVVFEKEIGEWWRITAGYFGFINDSNQSVFQYDRNIGSISVELHY
jgi:Tfp pilus assembly protein PilF